MRWLLVVLSVFVLAGCGSVDWFPASTGNDAAPNAFTFTPLTAQPLSTTVQSEAKTITGNNASGWTVTVSDGTSGANSQYSINGGAFTNAQGTILPNQTLRIQHTTAATPVTITTTNVQVGTYTTTFQSTTTTTTTP